MSLLRHMPEMSIMELIEFAGQVSAFLSFVPLIDTTYDAKARRIIPYTAIVSTYVRKTDDLQRNALGRKRKQCVT